MKNKKNNTIPFRVINFNEAYTPPVNKYKPSKGWIEWGEKNNYPNKTFEMYNYTGSSTSKSIINKKVALSTGKGFQDIQDESLQMFVDKTKLVKETKKADLDYEIINGFAFEVIWSLDGTTITSIKHIPIHKLRRGIECDEVPYPHFYFSHDWENSRKAEFKPVPIREWNPFIKQGKQIYVYYEYNPFYDIYPVESYSNCMNWIEMDYEISVFHINQLKQGYHPSFILNFATGIPEPEEMDEYYSDFEDRYKGTQNAGNYFLSFSEGKDNAPELTPVVLNDSDDRFNMLIEQSEIQIARGHEIPPQMVVLTPGKLSGTDERMELLKEFQLSYITPRQENIEGVLNEILKYGGYDEELKLNEYGMQESNEPDNTLEDE